MLESKMLVGVSDDRARCLAETIAWCGPLASAADAGRSTRTLGLRPPVFAEAGAAQKLGTSAAVQRGSLHFIVERRRAALEAAGRAVPHLATIAIVGRVYATNFESDESGAAAVESGGFFDDHDLPGWDTWFAHIHTDHGGGLIYGWVPPPLVELVGRGLEAIPVKSARWVDPTELQWLLQPHRPLAPVAAGDEVLRELFERWGVTPR